jgi:uncharacterized protein (DUF2384 family)
MSFSTESQYSYTQAIADLLGGSDVFGTAPVDRKILLSVSSAGLPKESARTLISALERAGHGSDAMFVWLQERLLVHTADQDLLSPKLSDITIRIAALLVALIGVFDALEPAVEFLLTPRPDLQGLAPVQAVFTPEGVYAVDQVVRQGALGMSA